MTVNTSKPKTAYCPNCSYPVEQWGTFCSNCGQKHSTGRVTAWSMVREFFDSVFNLDSRIFRTLGAIVVPGRLTIKYFEGKHKRYLSPLRIFFVSAVIHFATLNYFAAERLEQEVGKFSESQRLKAHQASFRDEVETAMLAIDSAFGSDAQVDIAFDSLRAKLADTRYDSTGIGYFYFLEDKGFQVATATISLKDLMEMPIDTLLEVYEIKEKGLIASVQAQQAIRIQRQGGNFPRYILGNLIWMVVLMMPAIALFLKLLYIRRSYYFVEHLVFAFHYHAFAFSLVVLVLWAAKYFHWDIENALVAANLGILVYLFAAMKKVYGQGFFKTLLKYFMLNTAYLFIFVLFISMTMVISALFF